MTQRAKVSIGDQVFAKEGGEEFGSVRHVAEHDLVVDVENHGDVNVPAEAVTAVHDGKVIVDVRKLPSDVQRAIAAAHAAEDS